MSFLVFVTSVYLKRLDSCSLNEWLSLSAGNYSALKFTFKLGREVGYYLMDYFIPSMMIVAMSWVTFWLQADASAPRITLGKDRSNRKKITLK